MGIKEILSIASIGIILLLSINIGFTNCSYLNVENSTGNTFGAWTSTLWKQTTEADFSVGVLSDTNVSASPGDVIIEGCEVYVSWHNNSWDYRKKITIDHTKVEGDLTDFPVLINLPTDSNLANRSQADGDDIFFTTSNNIRISHEIEEFDASTGKLTAWVKIPYLSNSTDTNIYMYYGNSTCTNQENATDVWDSNFQMVQHMEETTGTHEDSTVQGNDLTPQGSIDQNTAGIIGGADYYDGIDDYLSRTDIALNGDIPAKSTGSANNFTLSAWVKLNGSLDRYPLIVKQGDWDAQMDRGFLVGATGTYNLESEVFRGNDGTNDRSDLTSTQALSADQWYYATFTYNYVTDGTSKMYIYLNGVQNGSNELAYGPPIENTRDLFIGRYYWSGSYEKYFKGNIDEVRISNTVRSENWIKTSYSNQYSPSTFSSVNLEECRYDDQWSYKKRITINHTKVEGDLVDFPVLINISSDADLVAHAQADGDDILFTDSNNNKLSHEFEDFNGSTDKLISWVKVPNLSNTTDTEIYMHYGNPTCGSQENASGVWDSNFVMVQHLNEESGTHYDSTSYSNDGSPRNNVTQNATGWISGANDFDGIDDFIEVAHDDSLNMTGEMTIEAWIYPRELSGYKVMIDKTKTSSVTNYYFSVNDAKMNYGFYSSGWHESSTSNIISNDTWYHVVAVYNDTADNVRIYVNGDEKYNDIESDSLTANSDALVIGKGDPGSPEEFNGIIDELRISNKARSQSWINTSYNNQYSSSTFYDIGVEEGGCATTTGIIASQVFDTGTNGTECNSFFWDETLESGTDITFKIRASDTPFLKDAGTPSWTSVGGTSPVTSGLPSGKYMQWRATLNITEGSNTPILHEVRLYYHS